MNKWRKFFIAIYEGLKYVLEMFILLIPLYTFLINVYLTFGMWRLLNILTVIIWLYYLGIIYGEDDEEHSEGSGSNIGFGK